jgi:general stress protein CsbA
VCIIYFSINPYISLSFVFILCAAAAGGDFINNFNIARLPLLSLYTSYIHTAAQSVGEKATPSSDAHSQKGNFIGR